MKVDVHMKDHPPPHVHIDIPPGKHFTRYLWPELTAMKGDPELSSDLQKALDEYFADYGAKIDAKVRAVYTTAAPWAPKK